MNETVTIRVSGPLRSFIDQRAGEDGLYENTSEYIRDLIRRDFEKSEEHKWAALYNELEPAMIADETEFEAFDVNQIIKDAESKRQ